MTREEAIRHIKNIMPYVGRNIKDALDMAIETLGQKPCVTPQKLGKWLHDGSHSKNRYICSECGYKLFDEPTRSCPNCDTKMNMVLFDRYLSPKELKERRSRFRVESEKQEMGDSFEFTLHSPLTQEAWNKISDAEHENTIYVTFQTPQGRQVRYIKCEVLDKIRAKIAGKYRVILKGTPKDDWAARWNDCIDEILQILDKYKAEGSEKE